jgi:hypothetical protein
MSFDSLSIKTFLEELHRQSQGDLQFQASMYEIGASMGLAKGEAGSLAEELMVSGLVELRTLSGGISITGEGLAALGISAPPTASANVTQQFSAGPVADKADCEMLGDLIAIMKSNLCGLKMEYQQLEQIVIDLKAIEIQLLSPSPKVAVFRELLRSLHSAFQDIDHKAVTVKLAPLFR